MKSFFKIFNNKRFIYLSMISILVMFALVLNIAFSAFSNTNETKIANIKVKNMNYNIAIDGVSSTIIEIRPNDITKSNIILSSINNIDSKYELIYKICDDSNCNNFIDKPEELLVEYSSKSINAINGSISKNGYKQIRIIVTNSTNQGYYIKLDVNAGYSHNTLALKNLIINEYNEEDLIISALIDGEITTNFPITKGEYKTNVICETNNSPSNATGLVTWDGSKWILNVTGIESGRTICNVEFITPLLLSNILLEREGGITAIQAKGIPNFKEFSPNIKTYKELVGSYSSTLSSNNNRAIGKGYIFNEITGRYTLTDYITSQSYDSNFIGYYTCASTVYNNCSIMYKINEVSNSDIIKSDRYRSEANTYDNNNSGLYVAEDEYGASYYYRGSKDGINNNLIWAGFQWKIVRINGDGSIRIIYNGTENDFNNFKTMNTTGDNTQFKTSTWSSHYGDFKYFGYMYGGPNGINSTQRHGYTSLAATYNETSSNIKTELDAWYMKNILGKGIENNVVDNLFCNDRQFGNEIGGSGEGKGYGVVDITMNFAAYYRISTRSNPTFKCGLKNDRFTTSDISIGNGNLEFPIGLISADEIVSAGMASSSNEKSPGNYLFTQKHYWTISPCNTHSMGYTYIYALYDDGRNACSGPGNQYGLRPVLNLTKQLKVTGTGSTTDPFIAV